MKQSSKLLVLIFGILMNLFAVNSIAQNGMPIKQTTNKVTYSDNIRVPNTDQDVLAEKLAYYLSTYTQLRGTINGLYINDDKTRLSCVLSLSVTPFTKQVKCMVNAAVTIYISDDLIQYKITDLYTYGMHFLNLLDNEDYGEPIESSDNFNVYDFDKKNDNAKTTHIIITSFLANLEEEFGE
jgi:hypothetical protein